MCERCTASYCCVGEVSGAFPWSRAHAPVFVIVFLGGYPDFVVYSLFMRRVFPCKQVTRRKDHPCRIAMNHGQRGNKGTRGKPQWERKRSVFVEYSELPRMILISSLVAQRALSCVHPLHGIRSYTSPRRRRAPARYTECASPDPSGHGARTRFLP